jgi:hypothetical protein
MAFYSWTQILLEGNFKFSQYNSWQMTENNEMTEDEIDLLDLFFCLLVRKWLIIGIQTAGMLFSCLFSIFSLILPQRSLIFLTNTTPGSPYADQAMRHPPMEVYGINESLQVGLVDLQA